MRAQARLFKVSTCYGMQIGRILQHGCKINCQMIVVYRLIAMKKKPRRIIGIFREDTFCPYASTYLCRRSLSLHLRGVRQSPFRDKFRQGDIVGCCIVDVLLSTLPVSPVSPVLLGAIRIAISTKSVQLNNGPLRAPSFDDDTHFCCIPFTHLAIEVV